MTSSFPMTETSDSFEYEIQLLVHALPPEMQKALVDEPLENLIEMVMDLGRLPEARFRGRRYKSLQDTPVTQVQLNDVMSHIGAFSGDNRAGIPETLHRISAMRNRQGTVIGLTCRIGKAVTGTITPIVDLIESGKSILLLGPPGVGKTTKLREISKHMAGVMNQRVVIVDTSNEIAGDGDIPHHAVGRSRRMQVPSPERQKNVMIEAVENHTPEVVVVDEIGTEEEAQAARTIAERGVILVATAHGNTLDNVIKNPMLSDLIGGIQSVTLGDEEAKRRSSQKTILEREKRPTFDICIEIRNYGTMAVYPNVAEAVDHTLQGWTLFPEVRQLDEESGETKVLSSHIKAASREEMGITMTPEEEILGSQRDLDIATSPHVIAERRVKLFPYSLNKDYFERIFERLQLAHVTVAASVYDADAMIALRGSARPGSKMLSIAKDYEVPVFYAKANTMPHIQRAIREALSQGSSDIIPLDDDAFGPESGSAEKQNDSSDAMDEVRDGIQRVIDMGVVVEMLPRRSYIRRLQHELVENSQLRSISVGREPNRRIKILPPDA